MTLSAASALPLQLEKTDKKKREAKMPLSKYFKGKGEQVMSDMQDRYGADKGKQVFYGTANSRPGMKPADESKSKPKRRMTLGQRIAAKD
jgi:hypothetical protein